jgi:hypothetical protein
MIELGKTGVGRVRVRVDQARQHQSALQVQYLGAGAAALKDFIGPAHLHNAPIRHSHGLVDGESVIGTDDLSVMEEQIGIRWQSRPRQHGQQATD